MTNLIGHSIGRYHILEKLGEGGMAVVYKAYDTHLERDVAIKLIRRNAFSPDVLDRVLKRFDREAKSLAKLTHPNIVSIIDYGEFEDSPYLVMPYLQGGTLKQYLGKPMVWLKAIELLIPIGDALGYAHLKGIIHRDVKPGNILITEGGLPMLTDFGIARLLENEDTQTLTGTGVGVGTPEYMSPEQGLGREVDGRTDIYSLGVVLYELVTGRKPYTADTPMAVVLKQSTEPLPRPTDFVKDLPESIEKLLIKALAKNPDDRYQDMAGFTAALTNLHREIGSSAARPVKQVIEPATLDSTDNFATVDQMAPQVITPKADSAPAATVVTAAPGTRSNTVPIVIVGITVVAWFVIAISSGWFTPRSRKVGTEAPVVTETPVSTELTVATEAPVMTEAPMYASQAPTLGSTQVSPKDGMTMMFVPAGEFPMGSPDGIGYDNEHPQHPVYLDAYWIDQTEVTNAMYEMCVDDGKCTDPYSEESSTRPSYFRNSTYRDYPVINVDWFQAKAYCKWVGRELPTEAQWEKAARGTDGRTYPWGNNSPNGNLVNLADSNTSFDWRDDTIDDGYADTAPVGTYPAGKSPSGALDMAGNVWEWVADWSGDYPSGLVTNPKGPTGGEFRGLRGGSWGVNADFIRSARRDRLDPDFAYDLIGFRCSLSVSETP